MQEEDVEKNLYFRSVELVRGITVRGNVNN